MYAVAKQLKPGELSDVVTTATGTHIIKLISYSAEKHLTLDEVRNNLEIKFKKSSPGEKDPGMGAGTAPECEN